MSLTPKKVVVQQYRPASAVSVVSGAAIIRDFACASDRLDGQSLEDQLAARGREPVAGLVGRVETLPQFVLGDPKSISSAWWDPR